MWAVNEQDIRMTVGDYGVALPVTVNDTTFTAADIVKLTIKSVVNGAAIIEKTFSNIRENTFDLELTEEESAKLHVGTYVYSLDWYQDGLFMCNIIPVSKFKVVVKA